MPSDKIRSCASDSKGIFMVRSANEGDNFLNRQRRWQIERMFSDGLSHAADGFAERNFFRPGNARGLVRKTGIVKRSDDHRYEIFHGHGTDLLFLHSSKPEKGK